MLFTIHVFVSCVRSVRSVSVSRVSSEMGPDNVCLLFGKAELSVAWPPTTPLKCTHLLNDAARHEHV
jgi:hypothetical protein